MAEYGFEIIDYPTDFTPADELMGDFDVLQENVTVGGFETADYYGEVNDDAGVWRPDSDETFPLISFSHGFGMGDEGVWGHSPILNDIASAGYVVVAHKSAGYTGIGNFSGDQLRTLEWARESEIMDLIDWDAPTAVVGYSMGGGATLNSAANQEAIDANNIAVAVAIHPMTYEVGVALNEMMEAYGQETVDPIPVDVPVIPTLYAVGEADTLAIPELISVNYEASEAPKVWANLAGADHSEPINPEQRWSYAVVNMLDCHVKGDVAACGVIYGMDSTETDEPVCQICDCPEQIELVECEVAGAKMLATFAATSLAMALLL